MQAVLQFNLCAVSQPPEGAAVKLLPIRWLARGVAVAIWRHQLIKQYEPKREPYCCRKRVVPLCACCWKSYLIYQLPSTV